MSFENYLISMTPYPWTVIKNHPSKWLEGNNSTVINYRRFELIANGLREYFKPGVKVFDVGVYPGTVPKIFKEYIAKGESHIYTGVGLGFSEEFSSEMERLQVELYECDLDPRINNKLDRKNTFELGEPYDLCVFTDVIEHFFDPFYSLTEINKNLSLGGNLILTTDNITHYANTLNFLRGKSPNVPLINGNLFYDGDWRPHFREYSKGELIQLLNWAGFEVVKHQYYEAEFGSYKINDGKLQCRSMGQEGLKGQLKAMLRNLMKKLVPHLRDNHFIVAKKTKSYEEMKQSAPKLTADYNEWMNQRSKF